jgi:predicted nucleotidyltransferase
MSRTLQQLADEVGVHERTLRRAVAEGAIRGRRVSAYKLELPVAERHYVRTHWPTIGALRAALRTEPSVQCAVLFGSVGRGDDAVDSDLDVLVWMGDAPRSARHALARRLAVRTGREVDVLDVLDVRRRPTLLEAIIRDGRVLVDRGGLWTSLKQTAHRVGRQAATARRESEAEAAAAREFFVTAAP